MHENPFRIGGTVVGEYFTDRARELRRIRSALSEPQAKLLVYGPRRMGKSSAIESAIHRLRHEDRPALLADLSSTTTAADATTRILQAASRQLRPTWENVVAELVSHLRANISVVHDASSGRSTLALDVSVRNAPVEAQRETLGEALDAIERLAASKGKTIGIALDEFQELHRFGGEAAEWHLRGVIQRHRHTSYVLAGSQESIILGMSERGRALYKLCDLLPFGPIDEEHLAAWIESRMETHGVDGRGHARRIVELARPRTRDVIQLARAAYRLGVPRGHLQQGDVERALDTVVDEEDELLRGEWDRRTSLQQNVLRAIAAAEEKLFSEAVRVRYGLRGTSYVAAALDSLIDHGLVVKDESGYRYESPFLRRWVVRRMLSDIGVMSDEF